MSWRRYFISEEARIESLAGASPTEACGWCDYGVGPCTCKKERSMATSGTRKVFKYGTGDAIPDHAVYLCTKVQELPPEIIQHSVEIGGPTWLVWHYFLVDTALDR